MFFGYDIPELPHYDDRFDRFKGRSDIYSPDHPLYPGSIDSSLPCLINERMSEYLLADSLKTLKNITEKTVYNDIMLIKDLHEIIKAKNKNSNFKKFVSKEIAKMSQVDSDFSSNIFTSVKSVIIKTNIVSNEGGTYYQAIVPILNGYLKEAFAPEFSNKDIIEIIKILQNNENIVDIKEYFDAQVKMQINRSRLKSIAYCNSSRVVSSVYFADTKLKTIEEDIVDNNSKILLAITEKDYLEEANVITEKILEVFFKDLRESTSILSNKTRNDRALEIPKNKVLDAFVFQSRFINYATPKNIFNTLLQSGYYLDEYLFYLFFASFVGIDIIQKYDYTTTEEFKENLTMFLKSVNQDVTEEEIEARRQYLQDFFSTLTLYKSTRGAVSKIGIFSFLMIKSISNAIFTYFLYEFQKYINRKNKGSNALLYGDVLDLLLDSNLKKEIYLNNVIKELVSKYLMPFVYKISNPDKFLSFEANSEKEYFIESTVDTIFVSRPELYNDVAKRVEQDFYFEEFDKDFVFNDCNEVAEHLEKNIVKKENIREVINEVIKLLDQENLYPYVHKIEKLLKSRLQKLFYNKNEHNLWTYLTYNILRDIFDVKIIKALIYNARYKNVDEVLNSTRALMFSGIFLLLKSYAEFYFSDAIDVANDISLVLYAFFPLVPVQFIVKVLKEFTYEIGNYLLLKREELDLPTAPSGHAIEEWGAKIAEKVVEQQKEVLKDLMILELGELARQDIQEEEYEEQKEILLLQAYYMLRLLEELSVV